MIRNVTYIHLIHSAFSLLIGVMAVSLAEKGVNTSVKGIDTCPRYIDFGAKKNIDSKFKSLILNVLMRLQCVRIPL